MDAALTTPVTLLIFNRPELTAQVWQAIRMARPKQLLVIADGPRADVADPADEIQRVQATRKIVEQVDWPCEIIKNFSPTNLGCKQRVSSGLDWAFEQVEETIVLEDDCLPHPSFFKFCEQLLRRYREDPRIMMISGDNFQDHSVTPYSYYFSRWAHIWGWASWRRAWQYFDLEMVTWPETKASGALQHWFDSAAEYDHWCQVLDRQHAGEIDTWDFPWAYACWLQNGLTVLPQRNLISNLGFGPGATHTTDPESRLSQLPVGEIGPLHHPPEVAMHREADRFTWDTIFKPVSDRAKSNDKPRRFRQWWKKLVSPAA